MLNTRLPAVECTINGVLMGPCRDRAQTVNVDLGSIEHDLEVALPARLKILQVVKQTLNFIAA